MSQNKSSFLNSSGSSKSSVPNGNANGTNFSGRYKGNKNINRGNNN